MIGCYSRTTKHSGRGESLSLLGEFMMYTYTKLLANGEKTELYTQSARMSTMAQNKPASCIVDMGDVVNVAFVQCTHREELLFSPFQLDDEELLKLPLNREATGLLRKNQVYEDSWVFVLGDVHIVEESPF